MNISFIVTTYSRAVLRGQREAARGCRRVACRALFGSVFALLLAAPVTQAGPLRPGEILVADSGWIVPPEDGAIIRVDPVTGDRTLLTGRGVGLGPALHSPSAVWVDKAGTIYVADEVPLAGDVTHGVIYSVDPLTGDRAEVSGPNRGSGASAAGPLARFNGITTAPDGALFATYRELEPGVGFHGAVMRIDPASGNRTLVSSDMATPGPTLRAPMGIVMNGLGDLFVAANGIGGVVQIDLETGERSLVSGSGFPSLVLCHSLILG